MLVCIINRIPCFCIGKPGCSKSLSLSIINANLRGKVSPHHRARTGLSEGGHHHGNWEAGIHETAISGATIAEFSVAVVRQSVASLIIEAFCGCCPATHRRIADMSSALFQSTAGLSNGTPRDPAFPAFCPCLNKTGGLGCGWGWGVTVRPCAPVCLFVARFPSAAFVGLAVDVICVSACVLSVPLLRCPS